MAENPAIEEEFDEKPGADASASDAADSGAPDVTQLQMSVPAEVIEPDLQFIRDLKALGVGDVKKCFQCATCSLSCELSTEQNPFPRREMLWAGWGLKDRLLTDPNIFLCYHCNDCSDHCPRGASPGDVLAAIRNMVYKVNAVPAFMGQALGSPKALIALLLLPAVLLAGLMLMEHGAAGIGELLRPSADGVTFGNMLNRHYLDPLVIVGMLVFWVMGFAGFVKYYKGMVKAEEARGDADKAGRTVTGFFPALMYTIGEVFAHRRFGDCQQNLPRKVSHLLVLLGFVGTFLTTTIVFGILLYVEEVQGGHYTGLGMANPVKWLGVVSGFAIMIGSLQMISRRRNESEAVGANGYGDQLFLYMVFGVALTGMLSWIFRLLNLPYLAYPVYFIHLVNVMFLLWYLPYSKFAHMFYRVLALVRAKQTGAI